MLKCTVVRLFNCVVHLELSNCNCKFTKLWDSRSALLRKCLKLLNSVLLTKAEVIIIHYLAFSMPYEEQLPLFGIRLAAPSANTRTLQ